MKYSLNLQRTIAVVSVYYISIAATGCGTADSQEPGYNGDTLRTNCVDAIEGQSCVGWTDSEKRGWAGFCVSRVCTEYVPVHCRISDKVVTGCDGSGTVTDNLGIEFSHEDKVYRCHGVEGEFGYCTAGDKCSVTTQEYQNFDLIEVGVCE